jgi:glucose-6-phosphate 1-dehydrogenase
VEIANWRWAGVPFRLRSGKAMADHRREIVVTFQPAPHVPTGLRGAGEPDRIRIVLSPDELHLELNVNGPADPDVIDRAELATAFDPGDLPPYGQVIDGIISADEGLSVRGDTAEECWRVVEPVIAAWRAGDVPLEEYPAGTAGPWDGPQVAPKG